MKSESENRASTRRENAFVMDFVVYTSSKLDRSATAAASKWVQKRAEPMCTEKEAFPDNTLSGRVTNSGALEDSLDLRI